MKWKISLSELNFDQREQKVVDQVIKRKWLTMGETVERLEADFAAFAGAKHAVALSSGTAALHLAMIASGIKPGDEVIAPSLSFVASSNAILYAGARPVFVDVTALDDFNLSCEDVERKITARTKAIMVVHYGGYLADMERIKKIARSHRLFIIEDSAHAIGADLNSKMAGTLGDAGCFSFFSNKNMATGEGGMIVTNSGRLAKKLKLLRSHGMTSMTLNRFRGHAHSYDVVDLGYNYRMTEISAALGILQLKKLPGANRKREMLTDQYLAHLRGTEGLSIPFQDYPRKSSYHLFPILLNRKVSRKKFMGLLKKEGIQSSIHYQPIHKFSYYRKNLRGRQGRLPLTEHVGAHEVTLPLYPLLKKKEVAFVCQKVKKTLPEAQR
ncbi:MAG: DegT/DnrJ/EryC1/StrS family aminotransferase [Candidatus Zixiibacteriota bacterium]|nr:MAG: DegT/DnrJ/EryC1/StrS family aminotransferase [candidate division Zixibacteria bacterium]